MPWAYPRSRGATLVSCTVICPLAGLSPLTRGNRAADRPRSVATGPIPAHAGQPPGHFERQGQRRAYPRSRGATRGPVDSSPDAWGLSPLTRGNPPG